MNIQYVLLYTANKGIYPIDGSDTVSLTESESTDLLFLLYAGSISIKSLHLTLFRVHANETLEVILINWGGKERVKHGPFSGNLTSQLSPCQSTTNGINPLLINISLSSPDTNYTGRYKLLVGNYSTFISVTGECLSLVCYFTPLH